MHYNNSTGKDGVFVVEVARGADSQNIPESPITETADTFLQTAITKQPVFMVKNEKSPSQQEEVLIHQPPRNIVKPEEEATSKLQKIAEVDEEQHGLQVAENVILNHSNTGLSQSDLSSSSTDSNKAYCYGNQQLYVEDTPSIVAGSPKLQLPQNMAIKDKLQADDDQNKPANAQSVQNSPSLMHNTNTDVKTSNEQAEPTIKEHGNKEDSCKQVVVETVEQKNELPLAVTTELEAEIALPAVVTNALNAETANVLVVDEAKKLAASVEEKEEEIVSTADDDIKNLCEDGLVIKEDAVHEAPIDEEPKQAENVPILDEVAATEPEYAYDSLMSLPEPPSFDEIKQLSDCNAADINQLDSLPLPPPPPLFVADSKDSKQAAAEQENELLTLKQQTLVLSLTPTANNMLNGHQADVHLEIVPTPAAATTTAAFVAESMELRVSNGKVMLSTQLTPPESPPATNCSNSITNGMCVPLTAVAVNVNGS